LSVETLGGIEVDNLALFRGGRLVFRGVGFRVGAGQALAVEGANGAGKTSLLRSIAGFLQPRAGSIVLRTDKGNTIAEGEERGAHVGWLGHQDGLKSQFTPRETLKFFAEFYERAPDVDLTLERVGLARTANLPVQYLSAGQRKRLALARLVLSARPLWLLDEPLSALDAQGRTLVAELATAHCGAGGMVIAATHEPLGIQCVRFALGAP
jgi:heme exporter protein A